MIIPPHLSRPFFVMNKSARKIVLQIKEKAKQQNCFFHVRSAKARIHLAIKKMLCHR